MNPEKSKKELPGTDFDLEEFLPYLLNQAAEATSLSFQTIYAEKYGMTRTQWRVLANLGKFGSMMAKDICRISHVEKSKVSRAIAALESAGFLRREVKADDRRAEGLHLTPSGLDAFRKLGKKALEYDRELRGRLGPAEAKRLVVALRDLARLQSR
jgi:DNA-binding MarR family transcriptional regulator